MDYLTIQAAAAAFLASMVEFVEALTIVLAVGVVRGWKASLTGAAAAFAVLAVAVALLGPHIASLESPAFQTIVGFLLVLFGHRWLKKAVLRSAGAIALHDEAKIYDRETKKLREGGASRGFDLSAALTSFNGVFIEGLEVVVIVLTVGSTRNQYVPAAIGAAAAAVLVIVLGFAVRAPLTRIPENALKLVVGILVSSFGTLWVGEGLKLTWPAGDWSLLAISAAYAVAAGIGVLLVKRRSRTATAGA